MRASECPSAARWERDLVLASALQMALPKARTLAPPSERGWVRASAPPRVPGLAASKALVMACELAPQRALEMAWT